MEALKSLEMLGGMQIYKFILSKHVTFVLESHLSLSLVYFNGLLSIKTLYPIPNSNFVTFMLKTYSRPDLRLI